MMVGRRKLYVALLIFSYLVLVLSVMNRMQGDVHLYILSALFFMVVVCLARTIYLTPGYVRDVQEKAQWMGPVPCSHGCDVKMRRPERAHHCGTCGVCVLKKDHHCYFLEICIGFRNQKSFILMLFYKFMYAGYVLVLLSMTGLPSNKLEAVPVVLTWPLAIVSVIFTGQLLHSSVNFARMNLTPVDIDQLSSPRGNEDGYSAARYFKVTEGKTLRDLNKYDMGDEANFSSVFDVGNSTSLLPSALWLPKPLLWLLRLVTWPLPTLCPGDGVRFPHNQHAEAELEALRERVREARGDAFGRWSLRESLGLKPLEEGDIDLTTYSHHEQEGGEQGQGRGGGGGGCHGSEVAAGFDYVSMGNANQVASPAVDPAVGYIGEELV